MNCIDHLLKQTPYTGLPHEAVELPHRAFDPNYERKPLPAAWHVPKVYG